MEIPARAELVIARPRDEVFACLTEPARFGEVFGRYGPMPAVVRAEMLDGADKDARGGKRRVTMSDGMEIIEEIQVSDPPRAHGYGWESPGGGLSFLVRSAAARMHFEEVEGGTRVVWTYAFTLRHPLAWPIGKIVARLFAGWMANALGNARGLLV